MHTFGSQHVDTSAPSALVRSHTVPAQYSFVGSVVCVLNPSGHVGVPHVALSVHPEYVKSPPSVAHAAGATLSAVSPTLEALGAPSAASTNSHAARACRGRMTQRRGRARVAPF